MSARQYARQIERLEGIIIGAGFLLKKLRATYGLDFGVGMEEQVNQCIRDCNKVARAQAQRQAALEARHD